ncbi:MAG: hypothetical protein IK130_08975 [Oscillospiraceae bacterium]|nr:hypothetical protein [Oscillospiraceae bacterium]
MTLTEKFIADAIQLDSGAEVIYGSDQINDTYPCRFATVEFQLMATDALVEVADRIRMEKGYLPMHPRDGRTDDVDNDGFYDFYIGISRLPGENQLVKLDSSISFVVVNSDSDDNEDMYTIDLTASEAEYVYEILNRQCRRYHGKDCETLMAEAEKELYE